MTRAALLPFLLVFAACGTSSSSPESNPPPSGHLAIQTSGPACACNGDGTYRPPVYETVDGSFDATLHGR